MELAQQNLKAAMTALMPLLPFANAESCGDATGTLITLLKEALHTQDAVLERAAKFKKMRPQDLVVYLGMPERPCSGSALDEASTKRRKIATTAVTLSALDILAKRGRVGANGGSPIVVV